MTCERKLIDSVHLLLYHLHVNRVIYTNVMCNVPILQVHSQYKDTQLSYENKIVYTLQ